MLTQTSVFIAVFATMLIYMINLIIASKTRVQTIFVRVVISRCKPLTLLSTFISMIERCSECFGLFFAPGELEVLLDNAVSAKESINLKHIQNINNDYYRPAKVTYIKCPVCRILMNRINFGYHSGVVTDQCRKHGIWLDSGEITHLMEWKMAGGQLLASKKQ